jgi:hypothetical protein
MDSGSVGRGLDDSFSDVYDCFRMLVGGQVGFDSFDRLQHAGTCQLFFPLKDPTENAVFVRPLNTVSITTGAASELSVGSQPAIRIDHMPARL